MTHPHEQATADAFSAPLLARKHLGGTYHVLTFDAPETDARPGHFMMIRAASWGLTPFLARPMSILRAAPHLQVLVKVVGEGTSLLAKATVGQPFELQAPLGTPWSQCPDDHLPLLIAGGVGVAPLLFLGQTLSHHPHRPICLYGARSSLDLPLVDEMAALGDLRVATEDGSRGEHGLVTALLDHALNEAKRPVKVYTCGPQAMMAHVARMAAERDIPCEVSLEAVMACGRGVCLGCAVPKSGGGYLYACADGPCVDSRQIAWETP